ncbi:hypothetical protein AB0O39_21955 [Streptomyces anulatus]|uniref:hypothetical protein n=1 Tax=Streptomyces anulatus TaxID=1892 RepID=UPI0034481EAE
MDTLSARDATTTTPDRSWARGAFALPVSSVIRGASVLALGAAVHGVRRAVAARRA